MGCHGTDHGGSEPQGADRSQAGKEQSDGAGHFHHAGRDAEPLTESDVLEQVDRIKGTPASLAAPAARKAAARIPCNVQAPMRRVGRTDWMEAALILVSLGCEVESERKLGCRPSSKKPIYSDNIYRYLRYVVDAPPPGVVDVLSAAVLERSVGGSMSQGAHTFSDVIRLRLSRWFAEP